MRSAADELGAGLMILQRPAAMRVLRLYDEHRVRRAFTALPRWLRQPILRDRDGHLAWVWLNEGRERPSRGKAETSQNGDDEQKPYQAQHNPPPCPRPILLSLDLYTSRFHYREGQ